MQVNHKMKTIVPFVVVLLVILTAFITPSSIAQSSSADEAIATAKTRLIDCFNDAKAAEAAGANITILTDKLNAAGLLIAQAEQAYSSGNYYSAQSLATQSQVELGGLFLSSNSLENQAIQKQSLNFWINFAGSVCGTVAVLVGSVITWILLKRRFLNTL